MVGYHDIEAQGMSNSDPIYRPAPLNNFRPQMNCCTMAILTETQLKPFVPLLKAIEAGRLSNIIHFPLSPEQQAIWGALNAKEAGMATSEQHPPHFPTGIL